MVAVGVVAARKRMREVKELSALDFSRYVFSLLLRKCTVQYERTRSCGKHRDVRGDPTRIRIWYLFFTYAPVYR